MIFRLTLMIIIFIFALYILGKALLICVREKLSLTYILSMGFLLYYALFELVAFPMTLIQRSLTELTYVWMSVLLVVLIFAICDKRFWKIKMIHKMPIKSTGHRILLGTSIVLFVIQTYIMINITMSAWDVAYYIGGVNSSIVTDTMYIYDGSSGMRLENINIRYALSSFWTNDAVLAKIFALHGTIVCRYFNAIILSILSVCVVWELAKYFFGRWESQCKVVIFWMLANSGVTQLYYSNNFLLLRGMENKSYCCNFLIPIIILLILKIWRDSGNQGNWICLFVANMASVSISGTAMILVPILVGCCMGGHWLFEKSWSNFRRTVLCMLPCLVYMGIYVLSLVGWLQVQIMN